MLKLENVLELNLKQHSPTRASFHPKPHFIQNMLQSDRSDVNSE